MTIVLRMPLAEPEASVPADARRAADVLPWDRLRVISADPWRDIANGEYRALADAELARLGLRRS